MLEKDAALAAPVIEGSGFTWLEVAYGVAYEPAPTPKDILDRYTGLSLDRGNGLNELEAIASLMQERLGADKDVKNQWIMNCREACSRRRRS